VEFKKANRKRPSSPVIPARGPAPVVVRPISPPTNELHSPKVKARPKINFRRLLINKKAAALAVIGCLVIGVLIYNSSTNSSNTDVKKPVYQTVLPKGKTISELGGWKRVSPPKSDPVFAYTDTIDGIPVSVTEQPLPQSFKSDTANQVATLANKFNATDKIDAGNLAVYIGTSAKGPQSVIFAKNNLLVLIKSEKKVSDASWAKYAGLLN
jgi:hypothetical protein